MALINSQDQDFEHNKILFQRLAYQDGTLGAPINLSLESTRPLLLERLKWENFDEAPKAMKMTNTGGTVLVSAAWSTERPFLIGGPLEGNYVFSQLHFHWGSNEHEGSEHTVKGVCYPMEVHVIYFKSRYITQDAALKHPGGVLIVVYLVKLQNKTTPGLHSLASYLPKVKEPETYTFLPLPLLPLSCVFVPFTQDYLLYWGSLEGLGCSHTMIWFISRAALGITVEDLNMFRETLNSREQAMNKNFREVSPPLDRTVFHVNPSSETKHLLLPGTIDPPGQQLIVNYSQMSTLNWEQAERLFHIGDCSGEEWDKMSTDTESTTLSGSKTRSKINYGCRGSGSKGDTVQEMPKQKSKLGFKKTCGSFISSGSIPSKTPRSIEEVINEKRLEKQRSVDQRKKIERQRRQELEKNRITKNCGSFQRNEKKFKFSNKSVLTAKPTHQLISRGCGQPSEESIEREAGKKKTEPAHNNGECVHLSQQSSVASSVSSTTEKSIGYSQPKPVQVIKNKTSQEIAMVEDICKKIPIKEGAVFKSKLPIRTKNPVLQSTLTQYFSDKRPVSAPQGKNKASNNIRSVKENGTNNCENNLKKTTENKSNVGKPQITKPNNNLTGKQIRRPTTTIPRPLGKNAGKFETHFEIRASQKTKFPLTCPPSSPTKLV